MKTPAWKYNVVQVGFKSDGDDFVKWEKDFNRMGLGGWELVTVNFNERPFVAIFKCPVLNEENK